MSAQPLRSYALLFLSMTVVGSYVALSKPLVATIPVFLLAWMRFGIGGLAMLRQTLPQPGEQIRASTWRALFLQSLFGNFLFSICMLYGVSMTSATAAGVILATLPAMVALQSRLILGERLAPRNLLAVLLAVAGIATLGLSKAPTGVNSLAGNLLLIGAVACEAAYVVIGKQVSAHLPPLRVSALINLVGFLLMTPFGIWQALDFRFASVPPGMWTLLVFYALGASVFSVWLWMSGLRGVPANHAGVFTIALPLASTTIGVLFLGEHFGLPHGIALGCAVAGVLLVSVPAAGAGRKSAGR
ncbi:DMT family transporter [Niveibacterium umoris]|uniref:Drug/metabolite transporter (DMT)-like permease n=1 Tax=Niveibacterium umoris TaxID=1193620 RepID=A0A840BMW8_9RHOO|nr:DMT family transporter [Niveibacterium umoris]MBB4014320.1 drug/metabolite transporter (DMT)-like permease [Niveibacterium umoris]